MSDHALGVAGLIVGIVSAVGGLVAAAFGIWAAWLTKQGNKAAEADRVAATKARLRTIQPRPRIGSAVTSGGSMRLNVSNSGGAAIWHVLITAGDGLYYSRTDVGSGWISVDIGGGGRRFKDVPEPLPVGQFELHASVAQDIDGNVWDLLRGEITTRSVPDILNEAGGPFGVTFE